MTTPLISTILPTLLALPLSGIGLLERDFGAWTRQLQPAPEFPDPSQAPGNDVPVAVAPQLLFFERRRHTGGEVEASAVRGNRRCKDGHAERVVAPRSQALRLRALGFLTSRWACDRRRDSAIARPGGEPAASGASRTAEAGSAGRSRAAVRDASARSGS